VRRRFVGARRCAEEVGFVIRRVAVGEKAKLKAKKISIQQYVINS
jgi:hypothetical protein